MVGRGIMKLSIRGERNVIIESCVKYFLICNHFEFLDFLRKNCQVELLVGFERAESKVSLHKLGFVDLYWISNWMKSLLDQSRVWFKALLIWWFELSMLADRRAYFLPPEGTLCQGLQGKVPYVFLYWQFYEWCNFFA